MIHWNYLDPKDGTIKNLTFDSWEQLVKEIKGWTEIWEE